MCDSSEWLGRSGYYGGRLSGVVLFGSRAASRSRNLSDWDLLLVMAPSEPIRRGLYREWDERVAPSIEPTLAGVSPHFVHLPSGADASSPLWLEVASCHQILADSTGALALCLRQVNQAVEAGHYERRAAHGLRYWRRAG